MFFFLKLLSDNFFCTKKRFRKKKHRNETDDFWTLPTRRVCDLNTTAAVAIVKSSFFQISKPKTIFSWVVIDLLSNCIWSYHHPILLYDSCVRYSIFQAPWTWFWWWKNDILWWVGVLCALYWLCWRFLFTYYDLYIKTEDEITRAIVTSDFILFIFSIF